MKFRIPSRQQGKRLSAQEVIDAARRQIEAEVQRIEMETFAAGIAQLNMEFFNKIRKEPSIDVEFRVVKELKELTNGSQ